MGQHRLADGTQQPWRLSQPTAANDDEPSPLALSDAHDDVSGRSVLEHDVDVKVGWILRPPPGGSDETVDVRSGAVATLFEQPDAVHDNQPGAQGDNEPQGKVQRSERLRGRVDPDNDATRQRCGQGR